MAAAVVQLGQLSPVLWPDLETFARNLSEFCKVHVTPDHGVTVRLEPGEIGLRWAAGRCALRLVAGSEPGAQVLRDTLAHMLDTAREGLSEGVTWQGEAALAGQFPPNFRIARLIGSRPISPRFQRLRFAARDLGFMARSGLHLRLLQPKDPAAPVWPRLAANGRTLWPGAAHLHMPVYTIGAIDAAAGWLEVDVLLHGHGPTCGWARSARPGAVVGLSGPGGGWLPKGKTLCLGGDETALPMIARILRAAAPESRGVAIIDVAEAAEIRPLTKPAGVEVTWLLRGRDAPLRTVFGARAVQDLTLSPTAEVIFGGEKADALALRATLKGRFAALPETASIASYWTRLARPC